MVFIYSSLPSERYELKLDDQSEKYPVYCKLETLDDVECQGGGWTFVLKTGGDTVICFSHHIID
jgi:hypothetical protein